MNDLRISMSESHAFCHCVSHVQGHANEWREGGLLGARDHVFPEGNGQWLVGHEHVSMPAKM
jgi:hypothetical protein